MSNIKTHCIIVNHNNYDDFKNLINDLLKQDIEFKLTVVDQNSSINELHAYYKQIEKYNFIKIKYNKINEPLNHVWNWFYENHNEDYLSFLNNDIRIPTNFISDNERVFKTESNVAVTIHATNHLDYIAKTDLKYVVLKAAWQGWDYTIRRCEYTLIPQELEWFGGDCWIFSDIVYNKTKQIGCILSSPILHYQGKTDRIDRGDLSRRDSQIHRKLGFINPKRDNLTYVNIKPSQSFINAWLNNNK